MDSTCTLSTLIIVDVCFYPALCFGGQWREEFEKLRTRRQTQPDILFSITHSQSIRISGISGLIIMPHWQQCAHAHTHTHKPPFTHTQTNTRSIKDRLIKGNSLISVIKEGIIERLVHRDKN